MARRNARPNYNAFVAVRIPSPDIGTKVEEVQEAISAKDGRLDSYHAPSARNHITVILLELKNHSETKRAKQALVEATQKVTRELSLIRDPLVLNFRGLGTFSQRVLYAKVAEGPNKDRLITMKGIVESVFVDKGLARTEHRDYTPHLTITKMPYGTPGLDKIDPSVYAELVDTEFGDQSIEGLELLAMSINSEDGYYHCHKRLSFSSQQT